MWLNLVDHPAYSSHMNCILDLAQQPDAQRMGEQNQSGCHDDWIVDEYVQMRCVDDGCHHGCDALINGYGLMTIEPKGKWRLAGARESC